MGISRAIASLSVLTDGRFEMGIGTGRPGTEVELGLPVVPPSERLTRMREIVTRSPSGRPGRTHRTRPTLLSITAVAGASRWPRTGFYPCASIAAATSPAVADPGRHPRGRSRPARR